MWYDTGKQNIWAKKVFPIRKLGYKQDHVFAIFESKILPYEFIHE